MQRFTRRTLSAGLASGLATGIALQRGASAEPAPPVVLLFGDSIAASYGLAPEDSLNLALQAELLRLGVTATVLDAGLPGDTSAGGQGRARFAVKNDTAVCIVEFGGNDRARGLAPSITSYCLDTIVRELKARGITVVLTGLKVPDTATDAKAFNALYAEVAKKNNVLLCPDFMGGVTRDLRQADGAHPNPEGARVIAAKLAPFVLQALKMRS